MLFGVKKILQHALRSFFLRPHEQIGSLEKIEIWIPFLLDPFLHD